MFDSSLKSRSKNESVKFGSVQGLQYQLSDDVESLLYSDTGRSIHFMWNHCMQSSHKIPLWFFLTALLQTPQENLVGPGFIETSPLQLSKRCM